MAKSLAGFGRDIESYLQDHLPDVLRMQLTAEQVDADLVLGAMEDPDPNALSFITQQDPDAPANVNYPRIVVTVSESARTGEYPRWAAGRQYTVIFEVVLDITLFGQLDPARTPIENTARVRSIIAHSIDELFARNPPLDMTVLSLGPQRTNLDPTGNVPDSTSVEAVFVC